MATVLLISPNVKTSGIEEMRLHPPLGLAYIASVLEQNSIDVRIIDMQASDIGVKELDSIIAKERPKIVGITCLTPHEPTVRKIAQLSEKYVQNVVVGGAHATAMPDSLARDENIDYVVVGEGENTFLKLTTSLLDGKEHKMEECEGIAFLNSEGRFIHTGLPKFVEDLDKIPFPARHLLPLDKYHADFLPGKNIISIIAARGCPYQCTFCDYRHIMGPHLRTRSPRNVVQEMKECVEKFDADHFSFKDSVFTIKKSRVLAICEEIRKANLPVTWDANGRADIVDEEILINMKRAGCTTVYYGFESGNSEILTSIRKNIDKDQMRRAMHLTKKVGLQSVGYFIIGFPQDTHETIQQTIDLAKELDPDYAQFSICTPYPGTPMFREAEEKGLILTKEWERYGLIRDPVMKTQFLDPEDVEVEASRAYKEFYFRWSYIFGQLKKLESLSELRRKITGAFSLLVNFRTHEKYSKNC